MRHYTAPGKVVCTCISTLPATVSSRFYRFGRIMCLVHNGGKCRTVILWRVRSVDARVARRSCQRRRVFLRRGLTGGNCITGFNAASYT